MDLYFLEVLGLERSQKGGYPHPPFPIVAHMAYSDSLNLQPLIRLPQFDSFDQAHF